VKSTNIKMHSATLKNTQISNLTKIHLWRTELFQADGRTGGHDEVNSGFSHFLWTRLRSCSKCMYVKWNLCLSMIYNIYRGGLQCCTELSVAVEIKV